MFYDIHSTPSVYFIVYTSVINPFEVSITDKSISNDLALSTPLYFQVDLLICCFTLVSTARVILRWVVYRWREPVHIAL